MKTEWWEKAAGVMLMVMLFTVFFSIFLALISLNKDLLLNLLPLCR